MDGLQLTANVFLQAKRGFFFLNNNDNNNNNTFTGNSLVGKALAADDDI